MVVKEYKCGNATVRIHDDYITTDAKEKERILRQAWEIIDNARYKAQKDAKCS